jgi:hypothetical protein
MNKLVFFTLELFTKFSGLTQNIAQNIVNGRQATICKNMFSLTVQKDATMYVWGNFFVGYKLVFCLLSCFSTTFIDIYKYIMHVLKYICARESCFFPGR